MIHVDTYPLCQRYHMIPHVVTSDTPQIGDLMTQFGKIEGIVIGIASACNTDILHLAGVILKGYGAHWSNYDIHQHLPNANHLHLCRPFQNACIAWMHASIVVAGLSSKAKIPS